MGKNYYEILGLNQNASQEEIKKKYKELIRKYHPDICKDANAEEKAKEINVAYEILSDENKRRKYDENLKNNAANPEDFDNAAQEEPFDYQEEINKYTEREKEYARKISIEKIIKEEILKVNEILEAKLGVINSVRTVDNIIEDYYFELVEKWWDLANNYIDNLDSLKVEAESSSLNYLIPEINMSLNTLTNELQGMPLTILDAQDYLENSENKDRVINQIMKDINEFNTININENLYDQIIMGFINEDNYDRFRESRIYAIDNSLEKIKYIKKLAELYHLDGTLQSINNLSVYEKELLKSKEKLPEDYNKILKQVEKHTYTKEKEVLTSEIEEIMNELRLFKNRMASGVGNIVTLSEMRDITSRYKIAKEKLNKIERKYSKFKKDDDVPLYYEVNAQSLDYAFEEIKEQRAKHINEFFNVYTESAQRKDIKGLVTHENVGFTGICLLNATAATMSIIGKNYVNPTIPTSIILTSINVVSLKNKYKIYKHNYIKGSKIINSDQDTKQEYEDYCEVNKIKTKHK